jgi:hypothetical protein
MTKLCLLICLCFVKLTNLFCQPNIKLDTFKLKGHWTVCTSLDFSKDFYCDKGYMTYEFFENGTFKDPRPSVDGGGQHQFSLGKWTLKDSILTIDYDDTEFSQSPQRSLKIFFLTKDKFYHIGQEGNGVTVYTYFRKVD